MPALQFSNRRHYLSIFPGASIADSPLQKTNPRFWFPCKKHNYFAYWIGTCSRRETTEMVFDGMPAALHANIKSEDDV
jgi:hypothetical protein